MAKAILPIGFLASPVVLAALTLIAGFAAPLLDVARRLDDFDIAVFVSPNAVDKALDAILARRSWPARLRAATVGHSSEQALARHGIADVIAPQDRFDSEALLALAPLQNVAGRKIVVFRGDGGRDLLGDTLLARGAQVEYLTCYRRSRPNADPAPLLRLWNDGTLDAITLTSSEGLRNLCDMVGGLGQAWLRRTPVFVPHPRIAEQARAVGLANVVLTAPADDGLIAGLERYYGTDGSRGLVPAG